MSKKKAFIFSYLGNEVCDFALELEAKGFELEVYSSFETHKNFAEKKIYHQFTDDLDIAFKLESIHNSLCSDEISCAIVLIDREMSLTSENFEINTMLR